MPTGFVFINCNSDNADYVITQLKEIDAVKEIQGVFGTFDIIIKVKVDDKILLRILFHQKFKILTN